MNEQNIKKLLELFKDKICIYRLSNERVAKRYKVTIEESIEAKIIFRKNNKTALINHCAKVGINPLDVSSFWHKSKKFSLNVKVDNNNSTIDDILNSFDTLVTKYNDEGVNTFSTSLVNNDYALNVVLSDEHVGLDPNPKNTGLFNYEYNKEVYQNSIEKVFESILKEYKTYGAFEIINLIDLGDAQDGWDNQTTRGGHSLNQNMSNAEVFETYVDTKIKLIESIIQANITKKIVIRTLTNSNHSADFSLIISKAIEKIVNRIYLDTIVEIDVIEKFIDFRYYGDHCFIYSHGKDKIAMKYGLPLILNDKTVKFITDYIDFYEVKAKNIHFLKGDLHQLGFQKTKKFSYRNFMSLAPPSNWQQHNFGDTCSGYSIQVVPKYSAEISHTDYFLDYKKIN